MSHKTQRKTPRNILQKREKNTSGYPILTSVCGWIQQVQFFLHKNPK